MNNVLGNERGLLRNALMFLFGRPYGFPLLYHILAMSTMAVRVVSGRRQGRLSTTDGGLTFAFRVDLSNFACLITARGVLVRTTRRLAKVGHRSIRRVRNVNRSICAFRFGIVNVLLRAATLLFRVRPFTSRTGNLTYTVNDLSVRTRSDLKVTFTGSSFVRVSVTVNDYEARLVRATCLCFLRRLLIMDISNVRTVCLIRCFAIHNAVGWNGRQIGRFSAFSYNVAFVHSRRTLQLIGG